VILVYIIGNEEAEAVRRVIESGQLFRYRTGEVSETASFEDAWAEKIGVKHAVAVTSGTAALICGLVGMGIGPGDEVIVPAYTFMATALAPLAVGAVPVIADVDESLTLDPEDFERKITPRTRVVIPVHMCGLPCQMDEIMAIAREHDILVLEDGCQADGGAYRGRMLGSIGDAGVFSFNYYKIITCGEGGALVTDDEDIYERALIHHDGGAAFRSYASRMSTPFFAGWNFRMNEILSAVLRVQLTRLDGILGALRAEKRTLVSALKDEPAFCLNPVNDPEGDCGTTLALLFETPEATRGFLANLSAEGVDASTPIDSGRHVYTNWEPVLEQHGAHHPGRDAYQLAAEPVTYTKDMCARTLSILERTAYIETSATRSPAELEILIDKVQRAARGVK
jgi:dTDP-4-amino-4,6-dideoxygalactose transaminase